MIEEDLNHKSRELLEISPYGKVPVILVEGKVIFESAVINEFLDEIYPEVPLMPGDPYDRAQVRIWTDYVASYLVPPLYRVLKSSHPEKVERSVPELHKELAYLEEHLGAVGKPWFLGEDFSLADINFLPFAHVAANMKENVISNYPAINGWYECFKRRPSFAATLQDV